MHVQQHMVNPTGWLCGMRLALNGRSVTMAELAEHWSHFDPKCYCAPGLGYVCPPHRDADRQRLAQSTEGCVDAQADGSLPMWKPTRPPISRSMAE
jgi:hypothetical protein